MAKDFLDEIVAGCMRQQPAFADIVREAEARRRMAKKLADIRAKSLSQSVVAVRIGRSASVVSKLEAGGEVKLSTLQRYYATIREKFMLGA